MTTFVRTLVLVLVGVGLGTPAGALADPLPSWNDTDAKAAIIEFVEGVTDPASDSFVPEDDRIAVFDNDGTLWSEQPLYFQVLYALDVLREKADADPSILTSDVLRAAAEGDMQGMMAGGTEGSSRSSTSRIRASRSRTSRPTPMSGSRPRGTRRAASPTPA
jgi:hypothetical protein